MTRKSTALVKYPFTKAIADQIINMWNNNVWSGTDGITAWDVDVTVSTTAALNSAIVTAIGANRALKTRIKLSSGFTNTTATTISFNGNATNGNLIGAGGALLIEPETTRVNINSLVNINGIRGLKIRGVTFSRTVSDHGGSLNWVPGDGGIDPMDTNAFVVQRNSSRPLWSIVHFEDCYFGGGFSANPTQAANPLDWMIACTLTYAEEIYMKNCKFKGAKLGVKLNNVRRFKADNPDFQQIVGDCMTNMNSDTLILSENIRTLYPNDQNVYTWINGMTVRNLFDNATQLSADLRDRQFWNEHSDMIQHGTSTDTIGNKCLIENFMCYAERATYKDVSNSRMTAAPQGIYLDDTNMNLVTVIRNSLIAASSVWTIKGWNGSTYIDNCTVVRVGSMAPSATLGANGFNETVDPKPKVSATQKTGYRGSIRVRNCILGEINTPSGTGYEGSMLSQSNNIIANPTIGTANYSSIFKGTFTTDSEGRNVYTFTDDGESTQELFRQALYNQFAPKTEYRIYGVKNPQIW